MSWQPATRRNTPDQEQCAHRDGMPLNYRAYFHLRQNVCFVLNRDFQRFSSDFQRFSWWKAIFDPNQKLTGKMLVRKIHELTFYDDQVPHCPDKHHGHCCIGFLFFDPGKEIFYDLWAYFERSAIFSDFRRFSAILDYNSFRQQKNTKERSGMPNRVHESQQWFRII